VQVVNRVFDLGGARSLSTKDPLQRLHRDVHAATHGPLGNFNIASQPYARAVLGLDPLGLRLCPTRGAARLGGGRPHLRQE